MLFHPQIVYMKKLFILWILLLGCLISYSQEQARFPLDHILKGKERPFSSPAFRVEGPGKFLPDSLISACIADINTDSITSYLQGLENFGTRFMLADNHRDVAVWIKNKFISMGYTNAVLDSFECVVQWPPNTGPLDTNWQYNVFATLTGQVNPSVEVMVGGHYDAIIYSGGDPYFTAPGADDNGSSVAATLEIARVLKMKNVLPASSIVFAAWAGEERGFYGSLDKVIKALTYGEQVKTYLNLDMIANEPDTINWSFKVNQYTGSEWLGDLASEVALNHTVLTPDANTGNSSGSDSYCFYLGGFSPVYFSEENFCLNYHKPSDLVVNCNMPYCAEVTKAAMGTVLAADAIPSRVRYELFNPGTGNSLEPRWVANPETDLSGYKVRVGYSSGNYHQTFITANTSYPLLNLSPDTLYYVAVSAVNTSGYEGPATEYSDRPALVTMNEGILIVDDSEGGIFTPSDSTIDNFYRSILQQYQVTEYDAFVEQEIHLADLGRYSSVLWHINKQTSITVLNRYLNEVVNYLKLGGKILFTIYQPERAIYKISSYPNQWGPGSFLHDYMGVSLNEMDPLSMFNAGLPEIPGIPLIATDPNKLVQAHNYHLNYIEALWPENNNNILYRYGTGYDTATPQGSMHGTPVGIRCSGSGPGAVWKTVSLSFPLYYMDFNAAKSFTEYVMTDYFGEMPIGIPETTVQNNKLTLIPNPAVNRTELYFDLKESSMLEIELYNMLGDRIRPLLKQRYDAGSYHQTLYLTDLPSGLYFVKMQSGEQIITKKLIITKQ